MMFLLCGQIIFGQETKSSAVTNKSSEGIAT